MNRIDAKFRELRSRKEKAFIAYITAGDPSLAMTGKLVRVLESAGVDIVELGIPFSDPVADGPTIQAASQRALSKKANLSRIFKLVAGLRHHTEIPLIFMTYFNPVFKYGVDRFFKNCERSGVDGVIIPDLPCEEAGDLIAHARGAGISTIFLVAPTSTRKRVKMIAKISTGFIYYVSLTGVTGARRKLPGDLMRNVRHIKSVTKKPVAVGFGVSDARQAVEIAKVADGVIVGSAIVKMIDEKIGTIKKVFKFSQKLAKAIHNA